MCGLKSNGKGTQGCASHLLRTVVVMCSEVKYPMKSAWPVDPVLPFLTYGQGHPVMRVSALGFCLSKVVVHILEEVWSVTLDGYGGTEDLIRRFSRYRPLRKGVVGPLNLYYIFLSNVWPGFRYVLRLGHGSQSNFLNSITPLWP